MSIQHESRVHRANKTSLEILYMSPRVIDAKIRRIVQAKVDLVESHKRRHWLKRARCILAWSLIPSATVAVIMFALISYKFWTAMYAEIMDQTGADALHILEVSAVLGLLYGIWRETHK